MPTFPDLREFYDPALVLPIGGKEYRVEAPTQRVALNVRAVINGADVADEEYLDRILALIGAARNDDNEYVGGLIDEMAADGLGWPEQLRVAETAALHFGDNPARARAWWSAELLADAAAKAVADNVPDKPKKPARKSAPRKGK